MNAQKERDPNFTIEITAQPRYLVLLRKFMICVAELLELSPEETCYLEVCADEACANSIQAIRDREGETPYTKVKIEIELKDEYLCINVHDNGKDFTQHFNKADPIDHKTDCTRKRGYGLQIIKTLMDEVQYIHDPELGNHLRITKFLSPANQLKESNDNPKSSSI